MNVAILNINNIIKKGVKLIIEILLLISFTLFLYSKIDKVDIKCKNLYECIHEEIGICKNPNKEEYNLSKIFLPSEIKILGYVKEDTIKAKENIADETNAEEKKKEDEEKIEDIQKQAITEEVTERNIPGTYTNTYGNVRIKNQSVHELTDDMLIPDVEITNKKDVLIYHTHTCESYTPSEMYQYQMTGNYRTTDLDYSVVRVGRELERCLINKGFNVIHSETIHDYPSYNGSYDRSLETAIGLIQDKNIDLIFDIHRDAVGDGNTYGPTVKVNGKSVAQLMFVIGTNGSGLEHPNWIQNLKIAIRIQEKANEMYPGLFRPIVVRNSRYNQHLAKGASIIEVGATANTLDETILSMQCLANVLDEI